MKRPVTFLRKPPSNARARPDSILASFLNRFPLPGARNASGRRINRQFKPAPVGEFDIPRADTALKAFNYVASPDRKPARKHNTFTDHSTLPRVQLQADSTLSGSDNFVAKSAVAFILLCTGVDAGPLLVVPYHARCDVTAARPAPRATNIWSGWPPTLGFAPNLRDGYTHALQLPRQPVLDGSIW
jgi:hypothetical protein